MVFTGVGTAIATIAFPGILTGPTLAVPAPPAPAPPAPAPAPAPPQPPVQPQPNVQTMTLAMQMSGDHIKASIFDDF